MDMIGRYCIRQYLPSDILRQSRWEINFILKKQRCKEKILDTHPEVLYDIGGERHGVHDLVKRCSQTLKGYEEKLHLVEKFVSVREKVKQIDELLDGYEKENAEELVADIRKISDEIIEEL